MIRPFKHWLVFWVALSGATLNCGGPVSPAQPPGAARTTVATSGSPTATVSTPAAPNVTIIDASPAPQRPTAENQTATSAPAKSSTGAASPAATPGQTALTLPAVILDEMPASHLATGKRRVAAIAIAKDGGRQLLVFEFSEATNDAAPTRRAAVPLPNPLQSLEAPQLRLFMGRDDWPRIIVTPPPPDAARSYYRYRPNQGWQSPGDEQGALAAGGQRAGYYGFLGHQDPEVLCVPDQTCYEKRTQGWTKRPVPGPGVWNVTLTTSANPKHPYDAWAWPARSGTLLALVDGWTSVAPPPGAPLRQLVTWNERLIALTGEALFEASASATTPLPESGASATAAAWTQLTRVEAGTSLLVGPQERLLVGTNRGLLALASRDASPSAVRLTPSGGSLPDSFETTALLATLSSPPRYLAATNRGLLILNAP